MTISVTSERMEEIIQELQKWQYKKTFRRKQLESLLGKLQFISNCVRPGRLMVFRLREALRGADDRHRPVTEEMQKDIRWWIHFLPRCNTTSIMWMDQFEVPDQLMATDSCLTGIGAVMGKEYLHSTIPKKIADHQEMNIVHFELIAIIVAIRKWKQALRGKRFILKCDNQAVVGIINNGSAKEKWLQHLLRVFALEAATGQFEVVAEYISSQENWVPNLLSRIHLGSRYKRAFEEIKKPDWTQVQV